MLHCDKKKAKEDDSNETTGTCTLVFRYHHVRRRESFISIHQPSCCKNYAFSVASFLRTLSVSATTKSTPISPHSIITPTHTHTKTQQQKALITSKNTHMIAPAWRIVLRKHAREHVNTRKLSAAYGRRRRTASLTRARQDRLLLFLNRRVDADRTPCCSSVLRRWMNDMHCTCVRVRLVQIT